MTSRILRYAYPDRLFTELVVRSRALWDDLEAASGTELITRTGAIDHGDRQYTAQIADIFDAVGVDYEIFEPPVARGSSPIGWSPR